MKLTIAKATDLVLIAACVIIVGLMIEARVRVPSAPPVQRDPLPIGQRITELAGINFGDAPLTLLIVTNSTCPYCEQSTKFWQRLIEDAKVKRKDLRILAVSNESMATTQAYLVSHSVQVDGIVSAVVENVRTPTLVLVDSAGIVKDKWVGRPPTTQFEQQIINAIMSS